MSHEIALCPRCGAELNVQKSDWKDERFYEAKVNCSNEVDCRFSGVQRVEIVQVLRPSKLPSSEQLKGIEK